MRVMSRRTAFCSFTSAGSRGLSPILVIGGRGGAADPLPQLLRGALAHFVAQGYNGTTIRSTGGAVRTEEITAPGWRSSTSAANSISSGPPVEVHREPSTGMMCPSL